MSGNEILTPYLPLHPDETAHGFAGRLAAFHLGGSVHSILRDIGLTLQSLADGVKAAIHRLAEVSGVSECALARGAVEATGGRMYSARGEDFSRELLRRSSFTVCPLCVEDDLARGQGRAELDCHYRYIWQFRPVRTCLRHQVVLISSGPQETAHKIYDYARLFSELHREIPILVRAARSRTPSSLDAYSVARLEQPVSTPGGWLETNSLEQAVRACEMLGVVLVHGPRANLDTFTPDMWDEAGREGFAVASEGETAIRTALHDIRCRHQGEMSHSGPQAIYGSLYKWLNFGRRGSDVGPILDLMREHILDTVAIAPGANVLGKEVKTRHMHSVASLHREFKLHPARLRKFVFAAGLAGPEDVNSSSAHIVFPAEAGSRLASDLKDAIPKVRLPDYLNCSRVHANLLARHGLIHPIIRAADGDGIGEISFSRRALDQFLDSLERVVPMLGDDDDGRDLLDLADAATRSRCGVEVLVPWLTAGLLKRPRRKEGARGLAALLVDPEELRAVRGRLSPRSTVKLSTVQKTLGVAPNVVKSLIADRPGGPLLPSVTVFAKKSSGSWKEVPKAALEVFARDHVGLAALSRERRVHHRELRPQLDRAGIAPIADPSDLGMRLYRRSDLLGF
ncbi:TniQ family protein [Defluviimonas salinarum]|uniref:TniQ family protein n=1 Tax=Defluviimonas salinarum TaxID=2992147 RepID=A0ABT3J7C0_9RHOB|nr:TniQ family protein [Defluviimonas salinarum]MCW3783554.1 TniQ family protein [Defluviimonas salinarum]